MAAQSPAPALRLASEPLAVDPSDAPDEASALAVRARGGDQAALAGFVRATRADGLARSA